MLCESNFIQSILMNKMYISWMYIRWMQITLKKIVAMSVHPVQALLIRQTETLRIVSILFFTPTNISWKLRTAIFMGNPQTASSVSDMNIESQTYLSPDFHRFHPLPFSPVLFKSRRHPSYVSIRPLVLTPDRNRIRGEGEIMDRPFRTWWCGLSIGFEICRLFVRGWRGGRKDNGPGSLEASELVWRKGFNARYYFSLVNVWPKLLFLVILAILAGPKRFCASKSNRYTVV